MPTKFLNISTDNTLGGNSPSDEIVSSQKAIKTKIDTKQDTLVSGTNIKTVNGVSILGSGDITISSSVDWGYIGGTLSDQTDLKNALDGKQATISDLSTIRSGASAGATALQPNAAITGATKCKITYDSKGLVTAGADLQASDIPDISATYQAKLTAGSGISISSNIISVSNIDCGTLS